VTEEKEEEIIEDENSEEDNFHPELVFSKRGPFPSIEIDINYIPEAYQTKWTKTVIEITNEWIKTKCFTKRGTIWMWTTSSVNFHHQMATPSEFIVSLGFPKDFLTFLQTKLKIYFGSQTIRLSDYVSLNDEWITLCHVENSKVWKEIEAYTYRPI
jgi:hypothetical protein